MCTGCKVHKPKKELIRVVKAPDGEISVDFHGKKSGRGAYVCNDISCLEKAIKSRALERAFSCAIPVEIVEKLREELKKGE
ncbi:MAG: YlxR family protein [Oscillospiraceae bacterium]|nr:YlxR family protein [Oscillospiraceae bacterium]